MKTIHALIIGLSLIAAFAIFGVFFYGARAVQDNIAVVGAATTRFDSDIVKWRITLSRSVGTTGVSEGYRLIRGDLQKFTALLRDKGMPENEITIQPVNTFPNYNNSGQISGYNIQQGVYIITSKIAEVEEMALNPGELMTEGALLQYSNLEYFYSRLSEVKLQLLSEAGQDARRRAEQIAQSGKVKLGPPTSMRAGVFQITEPFSAEVSDYGMYNTQTKQKEITVTVRATFSVK